jgi:small subunit ribosomal protein S6
MRQGQSARRPVFPPSELSRLSEKGTKGYAPGRARQTERHSMPLYEHVYLARQDLSAQQVEELTAQYKGVIEQMGGKVGKTEYWGVKSLTYRMRKNRKAHFTLMNVDAPSAAMSEVDRQQRINEDVLRNLTIRVEEHEAEPSAMMRKSDRDDRRGGFDRGDRGGFDRGDRGERRGGFDRDRDRGPRPPRDEPTNDTAAAGDQE